MAEFIFSKQERGLKREPSKRSNLVSMGLFRENLQMKIHLEIAQKPPKDHIADSSQ